MGESKPRNGKILLGWLLFHVVAQGIYLSLLYRTSRRSSLIESMTGFHVLVALSGIYVLPTLGYLLMPAGQSRKFDRGFIVWGCVTTVWISLAWLAEK